MISPVVLGTNSKEKLFGMVCHGPIYRPRSVFWDQFSWCRNCKCIGRHEKTLVKLTELCICSDNDLKENKFIKSITESTQIVDGRVQLRMPWWKDGGPPKESNYDVEYQRMISSEKNLQEKGLSRRSSRRSLKASRTKLRRKGTRRKGQSRHARIYP